MQPLSMHGELLLNRICCVPRGARKKQVETKEGLEMKQDGAFQFQGTKGDGDEVGLTICIHGKALVREMPRVDGHTRPSALPTLPPEVRHLLLIVCAELQ
jgi:hypothetical protein